jgi:hypothetical protein
MTVLRITDRDRRVLMAGSVGIVLIVALGRGLPALRAHVTDRQRIGAASAEQLARREWLAANAPRFDRELVRVRHELAAYDSALVEGETPNTASARLAELVSEAVSDTDARLGSIRLSADTAARTGELAHVIAYASVTGDLFSIANVLQALETGPRLLAVSELSVASMQAGVARTQPEQLQAEIVVDGLYRRATRLGTSR